MSLLTIAAVIALVWLAFRDAPWLRRMLGLRRISRRGTVPNGAVEPDETLAGMVARAGGKAAPSVTFDRRVHRMTWGVRLLAVGLSAAAFLVMPAWMAGNAGSLLPPDTGFYALIATLVYGNLFAWAYRLEIDRDTLSVMGPAFVMRDYPLSGLEQIEEDGPLAWRMRFADGRRPHVIKTVVGAAALRHRLADVLEASARG